MYLKDGTCNDFDTQTFEPRNVPAFEMGSSNAQTLTMLIES